MLSRLDDVGELEEMLVVVIFDYGENFGEGGLIAHAFLLDDCCFGAVVGAGAQVF